MGLKSMSSGETYYSLQSVFLWVVALSFLHMAWEEFITLSFCARSFGLRRSSSTLAKAHRRSTLYKVLLVCWQLIKCSERKWMCYLNTAAVSVQRSNSAAILNPRLKFPSEMEIRESHLTCVFYFTPCPMFNNAEVGTVIYQLYFYIWGKIIIWVYFQNIKTACEAWVALCPSMCIFFSV